MKKNTPHQVHLRAQGLDIVGDCPLVRLDLTLKGRVEFGPESAQHIRRQVLRTRHEGGHADEFTGLLLGQGNSHPVTKRLQFRSLDQFLGEPTRHTPPIGQ